MRRPSKCGWKKPFLSIPLVCGSLALSSCQPSGSSLEPRIQKLEAGAPGVGEVMSAIQLHFAKLYFAAEAENWPLAGFEIDEIKENLEKAARMRPAENGVRLSGLVDAFEKTELAAMEQAVAKENLAAFRQSYGESIHVCNACHGATGRPFIIITTPKGPPVTNQLWEFKPESKKSP